MTNETDSGMGNATDTGMGNTTEPGIKYFSLVYEMLKLSITMQAHFWHFLLVLQK